MTTPESDSPLINQLEQAISAVPPNLGVARAVIKALTQEVVTPGADRERTVMLAGHAAALCGRVALIGGISQPDAIEFNAYSGQFDVIHKALGGDSIAQREPTNTAGKQMTGGKRVHEAL